ncbi:host specificity protein J [Pragia fontium]|uniref:host specificity protein J n=1 Tax=Pragia fontium TaxID=82985 RepID=UPI00064B6D87|nr:host specificity protein J [Pragia fontium]AKJ41483.1 host specificity protein [Pragia fontium]
MTQKMITGRKGGGSQGHTPVEVPDSIRSIAKAKILLALSEGEIATGITSRDIYLDNTPLTNTDGTDNFSGVRWEVRYGTQYQDYIKGMPDTSNETVIETEVSSIKPWVKSLNNTQIDAVRIRLGFPALIRQNKNGDTTGTRVEYVIEVATDGGGYIAMVEGVIDDKTTTLYQRTHRIDLPSAKTGWLIRVRRITPDSNTARVTDKFKVEAIAEVIDVKLRYPNTALLYVEFDAQQFPNRIPLISTKAKGRIIRVPTTYNPETREYIGIWDGSFKWAYSNNPAWVFYDLALNETFGLGDKLDITQVDKWELYKIAQYCDQMVPDGRGGNGMEPRFLCDVYIQSQNDAFNVLRDIASIFRGMTYWSGNQLCVIADIPRDVDFNFNRTNVENGEFNYGGGSQKNRYSSALVSWDNPENHYQSELEVISENDLIRRYGINQTEISAIGCTRQTEANRRGRWALLSNRNDRTVNFVTGLEGYIPLPGQIIGIADRLLSGKTIGGRVKSVDGRNITTDRVSDAKAGDRLILNLPNGKSEGRTIQSVKDNIITVTTLYSELPEAQAVWLIDADDLAIQQYRVTNISDEGNNKFSITGVWHDPDKYTRIDTGARIPDRIISVIPPSIQSIPNNIAISSYSSVNQGISNTTLRVSWDGVKDAIAYEAEWRKDNNSWISVPRTSALGFEVPNIYGGRYLTRVKAINANNISSPWGVSSEVQLNGKEGAPPIPVNFVAEPMIWGVMLTWDFPEDTEDTLKTEIHYAEIPEAESAFLLSDIAYPQHSYQQLGLKAGQTFYYRARIVDRTGNESQWTEWIQGSSNANASDYLPVITDEFLNAEDGKHLTEKIDMNAEAIINNALANDIDVRRWMNNSGLMKASIVETRKTIAGDQKAMAEFKQLVTARFEENEAAIETKSFAEFNHDGTGSAIYNVKAGVNYKGNYYDAGMSIGVTVAGHQVNTRVGFTADQFVLLNRVNGTYTSPFSVYGGQVLMNNALIQDGSITNAKIGNVIQSSNYIAGRSGWRLDKNGTFELNGSFGGSSRVLITNSGMSVYDENGVLRTRIGRL